MKCRRCRFEHGVVDGVCGDCGRWDVFTAEEQRALRTALATSELRSTEITTTLRLQLLGASRDSA